MTAASYRTIPNLLNDAADSHGDRAWLRTDDDTVSFVQARAHVAAAIDALRVRGVTKGDLVMVTTRTTPAYALTWLAVASMGAVAVTVNPASTAAELAGLLAQTSPGLIVTDDPLVATVVSAGADPDCVVLVDEIVSADASADAGPVGGDVTPGDVAVLIPTSGTTGRSKLVMQTHRAYGMAGEGFPWWLDLSSDDVLMTALPLFHLNAPAYSMMGSLAGGCGLVLLERFSASGFLDAARRHGATEFNAIGAMVEILMRQPERPDDADTPLRLCYTGPSPSEERQLEIERRFGLRVTCGYAMSESPYGLVWPRGERPYGTLGVPRQHPTLGIVNEARVVDGELLLRNPAVTPGYWNMPEETARVIVDGWLHTGDLVTANADGTYTFVSRIKEVLRRRGENLSPVEVQDVLELHPDVAEAAVVGVPSDLSEEEIKAFVVLTPGAIANLAELRTFAAERLAPFKVPRYWQVVAELPRTPTQRIAKHRLPTGHPDDEWDAEGTLPA
ncbi:MAG TPA: AMP-binding protein [Mycobacteriales bacterium]|nr:AMP-binding protein [Mycobacteriales bacterium]